MKKLTSNYLSGYYQACPDRIIRALTIMPKEGKVPKGYINLDSKLIHIE